MVRTLVILQGCSLNPQLDGQRRRWESNPLENCFAGSRRTVWLQRQLSVLARNRTWTATFAGLHANPAHPEDVIVLAARRGVEPRLAVSRTAVRSGTLAGCVNQYPDLDLNQGLDLRRVQCKSATPSGHEHEREESNPVEQFWRLPALPGAHSCTLPITTMGSQGIRRELNPYLLVHSQACSDRYTTDTISISSPTRI
jgi:hypothetical protein